MPVPASQKRERPEDQVAGNTIRCDDEPARLNSILDQDLAVGRHPPSRATSSASAMLASTCRCRPTSPSLPPERTPTFSESPNFLCDTRPFFISSSFSCNGPAFIHTYRGKQEFFPVHRFQKSDAFKMVDTLCFFKALRVEFARERSPDGSIDLAGTSDHRQCLFRVGVLGDLSPIFRYGFSVDNPRPAVTDRLKFPARHCWRSQ